MPTWTQDYDPVGGSLWLSAAVAVIPIVFFFIALAVLRMKGHIAALITVALAVLVAVVAYGMPTSMALAATGYGFLFGLWPISWIIVAAVFLYKLTVKTGQFEVIRSSVLTITADQRLQMVLIGFCFGAFLEGRPDSARPSRSPPLCWLAWGSIRSTLPVFASSPTLPPSPSAPRHSDHRGRQGDQHRSISDRPNGWRQLPLLALFVPFWLVYIMDGARGVRRHSRRFWWPAYPSPFASSSPRTSGRTSCRTSPRPCSASCAWRCS